MAPPKGFIPVNKKEIDLELMQKLYYEDKKDYKWIADYFGLKSKSAIYERFQSLGLKARDNTDLKTGTKHSEETKKKISLAGIGRKFSEETKNKMSERFKGNKNPMFGKFDEKSPVYKGGCINPAGYRLICKKGKQLLEHHWIWEQHNITFPKGMNLHHIDGNKLNNAIGNLQLMTNSNHQKLHYKERKSCGRFRPN